MLNPKHVLTLAVCLLVLPQTALAGTVVNLFHPGTAGVVDAHYQQTQREGGEVKLWKYLGGKRNQSWELRPSRGNSLLIQCVDGGRFLSVVRPVPAAPVALFARSRKPGEEAGQRWILRRLGMGLLVIQNVQTGLVLQEVKGRLFVDHWVGHPRQVWMMGHIANNQRAEEPESTGGSFIKWYGNYGGLGNKGGEPWDDLDKVFQTHDYNYVKTRQHDGRSDAILIEQIPGAVSSGKIHPEGYVQGPLALAFFAGYMPNIYETKPLGNGVTVPVPLPNGACAFVLYKADQAKGLARSPMETIERESRRIVDQARNNGVKINRWVNKRVEEIGTEIGNRLPKIELNLGF